MRTLAALLITVCNSIGVAAPQNSLDGTWKGDYNGFTRVITFDHAGYYSETILRDGKKPFTQTGTYTYDLPNVYVHTTSYMGAHRTPVDHYYRLWIAFQDENHISTLKGGVRPMTRQLP